MAEIEFLLPTVQYGNLKVRATPEELGVDVSDAAGLGATYAVYLNAFQQGFKLGSQVDVTVDIHPTQQAPTGAAEALPEPVEGEAQTDAEAIRVLKQELGATVVEDDVHPEDSDPDEAPWTKKTSTVDAKPKPWDTGNKPAKVANIDW